ncbi:MAG: cation transporter [Spirochaetaceae bacterium]|nr:MAG: cation transporter [Spirochaetaceae bacterium]
MSDRRHRAVALMSWSSIAVNTVLFGLKFWAGTALGSVAIVADAWHTLSDSLSSAVVLAGARTARKPADSEHPFGHGRAELIAAVVIGAFLGAVGFNIVLDSVAQLRAAEAVEFGFLALAVCIVSVVSKEVLAQGSFLVARRTGSASIRADGWHHRSDAVTSLLILIGIVFGGRFWWIDGVLGIIVALFLLYAAIAIIREGSAPLLGETPSRAVLSRMHAIAASVSPRLGQVHHVHIHRYGDHIELTCHVRMDGALTVDEAHAIVSEYESALREELKVAPTVHVDPRSKRGF